MRMNRRNVLVGLGTIVAGGGAALGTGAFSSVNAERTVSVDTTNDSTALLSLELTDTTYTGITGNDGSDGTIQINIDQLNDNAITTFDNVLTVSNGGSEPVDLSIESSPDALTFKYDDGTDLSSTSKNLVAGDGNDGNSVVLTIEVDLNSKKKPSSDTVTFDAVSTATE